MRALPLLCLLALVCRIEMPARQQPTAAPTQSVDTRVVVPNQGAMRNILTQVDPVYPPLAKAARIEGVVRFQIVIAPTGRVVDIKLIDGHPLLIQAAKQALQQLTFKPFLHEGQPVPANATIEIPFTLGIPSESAKQEQALSNDFNDALDECRAQYKAQQYTKAETACRQALKVVDQLPPESKLVRVNVHGLAGQVLLAEKEFSEAALQFQQELAIAQTFLRLDQAELAYAHYHMALGDHLTGKAKEADAEYSQAEQILTSARKKIGDSEMEKRYDRTLKQILQFHATLLKQMGNNDASADLTRQADQIPAP